MQYFKGLVASCCVQSPSMGHFLGQMDKAYWVIRVCDPAATLTEA